jgi:citrate synthase
MVYLLWEGNLPNASQLKSFSKSLAENRALPAEVLAVMENFPKNAIPWMCCAKGVTLLAMLAPGCP